MSIAGDGDAAAEAVRLAAGGADPGTLVVSDGADWLRCAVVLHPDAPMVEACRIIYVGVLGLGDALGAVVPAGIDMTFHWPGRIDANAAPVARVGLRGPLPLDAPKAPDWLVLTAEVAVAPDGVPNDAFGTTLRDEGCAEVTTALLLESFARHLLTWVNRWQDDGFRPIRAMWLRHAYDHKEAVEIVLSGKTHSGVFAGIDDAGDLELVQDETILPIALAEALAQPISIHRIPAGGDDG